MSTLSNKYHRVWCALVGGAQWVGRSCVTSAHFSHCACSGLWLLTSDHDNLGSQDTTLIPVMTVTKLDLSSLTELLVV